MTEKIFSFFLDKLKVAQLTSFGNDCQGPECDDDEILAANIVYGSPEAILGRYRDLIRSEKFQERLVCVAIDEAHIVCKW